MLLLWILSPLKALEDYHSFISKRNFDKNPIICAFILRNHISQRIFITEFFYMIKLL